MDDDEKIMLALSLTVLFPLSLSSFVQTRPNLDVSEPVLKDTQISENETIEDNEEQTDQDHYRLCCTNLPLKAYSTL
ncbi:hypothetical protein ACFODO_12110 [Acinetobacter sichuanensis]|uniref:Uncharacterized protein n=2 Tax=Acinetobacter sichuanensis TaxID=2136183 RepID=A0ABV7BG00_9GAMM|nr:hypothetical protein [Acinetobacter sichuanensis]